MDVQEILTQIDHAFTEIDLVLHQWQEDLDMMSFIGVNATLAMWTDEVPPRVVTSRNISLLPLQGIHDVRVMHFTEDGWTKVGTARINESGNFIAKIDRDIPGITDHNLNFSIDEVGTMFPLPVKESLNKPLTVSGLDKIIKEVEEKEKRRRVNLHDAAREMPPEEFERFYREQQLENHPFFKEN